MIGRLTLRESFEDLGDYLLTGKDRVDPADRVSWMEFRNLPTARMDVAALLMAGTASISTRTRQPALHLSISFALGDPVDKELMLRVMLTTIADQGLEEHQAAIVAHHDTENPHVHAMINRVHPETGRAWKGSWSKVRVEASLRRQEKELGLRIVPGWLAPVPGEPERRPQPRLVRGSGDFLRDVQERATPVLERAQSWSEVERGLADFGLSVRVNGRGMSVTDGRREVKVSEIGRAFSRHHMEKRLGRFSDYRARVAVANRTAQLAGAEAPTERSHVAPPAAPAADTLPLETSTSAEVPALAQLSLAFTERPPPTVALSPPVVEPPTAEPPGSPQLMLGFEEAALRASPGHRAEPPAITRTEVTPVERVRPIQLPYPPIEPAAPREQAGADPGLVSPPASEPTESPAPAKQTLVTERPGASSGKEIPPWLGRVRELIRESLDCNQAITAAYDARAAEDAPAQELERLKELEQTALADGKRLQEALGFVYLDSSNAALELTQFGRANGWMTTQYALMRSPWRFGNLRGMRFWYTMGPGRKYVENVLAPLESALRSEGERPTQADLEAARANLSNAVKIHGAARDALLTFRAPQTCEKGAARLLQPRLGEFSAAEIAQRLAELLPPEDREAAKLVKHIVNLAISLNQMLSRNHYPGREWE